jgi:hypothetical protein
MTNRQVYTLVGLGTVAALEGRRKEAVHLLQEMEERSRRE